MSEWSTSLGYCAADRFPDSDDEDGDNDGGQAPLQSELARSSVEEETVTFTETPFTIAARNAQVRKARQPGLSTPKESPTPAPMLPRATETPLQPFEVIARAVKPHLEQRTRPNVASMQRQIPPVPLHEIRHVQTSTRASAEPSDIIVISSDSDEVEVFSTACMHDSIDTRHRASSFGPETHEQGLSSSEQALQQLFDENHDFYESLDREVAQNAAARSVSEVSSSSFMMESMVPDADASTSYETSNWAPTRSVYSHEAHPTAILLHHGQEAPLYAHQTVFERSRPSVAVSPPFAYAAAGNLTQSYPSHYGAPPAPPPYPHAGYMIIPGVSEASRFWNPADRTPFHAAFDLPPDSHQYTQAPCQPSYPTHYQSMYLRDQQGELLPAASSSSAADLERAKLASYRRPRSPRQAQEDKAKADMVYKALRGASKRARTKSTAQARPSPKEPEWSTLKASRVEADGSLSLTAALRRPLPATRLAQASRGGSRLSLPLYRALGSSAEDRRRAEIHLHDTSSKQRRSESSIASTSKSAPEATRAMKLFRPSPLTESEQYGRRR